MVSYFYKTFYQNLHVLQGGFDLKKLTLIVPCFNEQEALPFFYKEAISVLKNLNYEYELLFINDGSKDNTLKILKDFAMPPGIMLRSWMQICRIRRICCPRC